MLAFQNADKIISPEFETKAIKWTPFKNIKTQIIPM
jgi:hypothetical protein